VPLPEDLREQSDVPLAFASVLEGELGDDALLTIGIAQTSVMDVLQDDQVRGAVMLFSIDGAEGQLTFVALEHFAQRIEQVASDELLLSTATPPLEAAAHKLAEIGGVDLEMDAPREAGGDEITQLLRQTDLTAFPILDGTDAVACLVIGIRNATAVTKLGAAEAVVTMAVPTPAPSVLADVEMGVTAELGRTEMTVRDLLALTPGAVIDLDRTEGALVDVLVNGTPIARGEVVVVDEQFGIRISEILTHA